MRARLIALGLFGQIIFSLCAGSAWAACVNPPASDDAIAKFKSNPDAVVAQDADTRTIEATVRDLTATDANLAAEFVRLAKHANPRFQTAIAAGLAQAAVACTTIDQQAALLIQQSVASFEDSEFQTAFAAVAGDLSTAATEAAAASAVSAVGSVTITNPVGSTPGSPNFSGGGSPVFFQIASDGPISFSTQGGPSTPPSGTTTAANPVSATH